MHFLVTPGERSRFFKHTRPQPFLWLGLLFLLVLATTPSSLATPAEMRHPLDPLTKEELALTVAVLRQAGKLAPETRFVTIYLKEPAKEQVLSELRAGKSSRVAFALLYNWTSRVTSEAAVALNSQQLVSWKQLEPNEPPLRVALINRLEEIVKADVRWQNALRQRGIHDFSRVSILPNLGEGQPLLARADDRFVRAFCFLRDVTSAASLLRDLAMEVNVTQGQLTQIKDQGVTLRPSLSPRPGAQPAYAELWQTANRPGFRLRGSEIRWQNWRLHYGLHPRRGLELYDVAYADNGQWRSVLYRASVSEMIAPYGDPAFGSWYPQDEGDYGIGSYGRNTAVPLHDAPANAVFAKAVIADAAGRSVELPRAVAIYERDGGLLWRHAAKARRAPKLVLTAYATIDNYDYAFNWIFSQDGTIEVEVMLTGMMNVRQAKEQTEDERTHLGHPMFGHLVAPGVNAPNYQHFFSFRLDFDIDGPAHNEVLELNTQSVPSGEDNPKGEWFTMTESLLPSEQAAQRTLNLASSRKWKVVNTRVTNTLGQFSGYALLPGENSFAYAAPGSAPRSKAGFINTHLWVTPYQPDEMYAAGDYVNQNLQGEGLPKWTRANRSVEDQDVVVWYTLGVTHIPRTEDWPIMPVHPTGFRLVPAGFFSQNPALPRPTPPQLTHKLTGAAPSRQVKLK